MNAEQLNLEPATRTAEEIMQSVGEHAVTGLLEAAEDSVQTASSSFSSYL